MTEVPPTQTNSSSILHDAWMRLQQLGWGADFLVQENPGRTERLDRTWQAFWHPHQRPPEFANNGKPWTTWLILGGRGAGKTRAGAQWVRSQARQANARIALVGETDRKSTR